MKPFLYFLLPYLFTLNCSASITSDSTYFIQKRGKRITYYSNGIKKQHMRYNNFFRKGKIKNYDSLGNILSKGKTFFTGGKVGIWKEYENGKITNRNRYKYNRKVNELRTQDGKKTLCYFTYGLRATYGPCSRSVNTYRLRYLPIAGCLVSSKLVSKAKFHNFFVNLKMSIKHGYNWNDKIHIECDNNS